MIRNLVTAYNTDYTRFLGSLPTISGPSASVRPPSHGGKQTAAIDDLVLPTEFEQWLPFAAKHYVISPRIEDYFFRPVPLFITDLPNRNGVGFPAKELARWSEDGGCQAYLTWRGKPLHVEHEADDPTQAIGVVVDVIMRPLVGYGDNRLWKVIALNAIDRTKRTNITSAIEAGKRNTWSMGSLVHGYTCSYCGAEVGKCSHIDENAKVVLYELDGQLVYRLVNGIFGVEFSSVGDPAYGVALSDVDRVAY